MQPQRDCHTAVEGDACYTMVAWAMETGVVDNPDWFVPLTKDSSFEDFQRYTGRLSDACPEPCEARALDVPLPAGSPSPEECHTSVEGDECYRSVVWAMRAGIVANPGWYARSGLTENSSFEEFQRHMHGTPRLAHVCPEPCAAAAPEGCRTSVEGDACFEKVVWAMQKGIVERPGWYPSLTKESRFEDFQRFLHGEARLSNVCPEPCALQALDAWLPARAPAPEECHTSVEGDACYEKVVWAMQKGVLERPGWYPSLTKESSFEDFQRFLHGEARLSHVCPEPCAAHALEECRTPIEGDTCYKMVAWSMQTGIVENPAWFAPLTKDSSFEDFQRYTAQHSDLCLEPCAAEASNARLPTRAPAPEECHTSVEGDACHEKVVWAMRAGIMAKPGWYARSGLTENSSFEDFQRHLHGTARLAHVCPEPCPAREATERVGRQQLTPQPTPEPTTPEAAREATEQFATPEPTLEPGLPCTCNSSCGAFTCVDTDGDGCIALAEAARVDGMTERFSLIDADGDACVNKSECDASGFELPLNGYEPGLCEPDLEPCGFGRYRRRGTTVCVACENGETRRRRSTDCTECPEGTVDNGDFDECMDDVWVYEPMMLNDPYMRLNRPDDMLGQEFQVGDCVTIRYRNPEYEFERFYIVGIVDYGPPNGTAKYELDHGTSRPFEVYDPVTRCCTGTNGLTVSDHYKCGCGVGICNQGECCSAPSNPNEGTEGQCMDCSGTAPTPAPTVSARGDPHLVNLQGEHFDVNHGGEFTLLRIPQVISKPAEIELRASIRPEHGKPCTTYITEVELSGTSLNGKVVQVRSYKAEVDGEAGSFLGLRVMTSAERASAEATVPWVKLEDWTDMPYLLAKPGETEGFRMTLAKTQWRSKKSARDGASNVAGQVEVQIRRRQYNQSTTLVMRQDLPMQEHLNLAVRQLSALGRVDIGGLLGFDAHPASLEDVTPECQRHRDGLDTPQGPHTKPAWKTRWEKIKEQRSHAQTADESKSDNVAAASLVTRAMMCVCAASSAEGPVSDGDADGVLADFQTGRLAEATWD